MPDAPLSTVTQVVPKQGRDAIAALTKNITADLASLPDSERPPGIPAAPKVEPETKPPVAPEKPKTEKPKVDVSKQVDSILKDSKLPISLTKETAKETKAEPAPEVDDNEPLPDAFSKSSPKVQEHFKSLKIERNKLAKERDAIKAEAEAKAARAAELETKLKELEGRAAPADYEQTKKERDAFHNQLLTFDTLNHPQVKARFEEQTKIAMETATAYLDGEDKAKVETALALPEGRYKQQQLQQVMSELDDMSRMNVLTAATELRKLNLEKEQLAKKAEANRSQMHENAQQEQRQRQQQFERVIDTVLTKTDAPGMELFQEKDGEEEWNSEVSNRRQVAKKLFMGGFTPEESARFAAKAAAYDRAYDTIQKQEQAIGKLVGLIEQMQGASPSMSSSAATQKPTKPLTYAEHLMKIASGGES